MKKSKKIFVGFSIAFVLFLMYVGYDMSRRTTFPGSKSRSKEQNSPHLGSDSLKKDSLQSIQR
ncbi:MAG: hypothetical protein JST43_05635 [Bacteroidetes bacterium]|nr:hypothetical protein [Bacteroidota bacterium]MBS1539273.1 hypothetical protein [Bacteroidota bacterium]